MSTAIIAHADRDGIVASGLLLRHGEPGARVFPVGRVEDVNRIFLSCAQDGCPDRFYVIGYACRIPSSTWRALHPHNPRVHWFDHHVDEWAGRPRPPEDLVQVFLPRPGERNAPASMVAEHLFGAAQDLPPSEKDLLMRIYEVLPMDETVEFLDGLHAGVRGVRHTEMTDFVRAVMERRVPARYRSFLEAGRALRRAFLAHLDERPGRLLLRGDGAMLRMDEALEGAPRAVLSAWVRAETAARWTMLDLGEGRLYINVRHDVPWDLHAALDAEPGLRAAYRSGHPYVAYLDGAEVEGEDDPARGLFARLAGRAERS